MVEIDDISENNQKVQKTRNRTEKQEKRFLSYRDIHLGGKDGEKERDAGISDFYNMLSIALAALTYFYRNKITAWLCLYVYYCSIINHKLDEQMQQAATSFGFLSVAFLQTYAAPTPEEQARIFRQQQLRQNPDMILSEK